MTKTDIISGFLGAGKTTLIKKLLNESLKNEKVVIIENEFGEIGIDSSFLKESGIEIRELNSGCICCTLTGDFTKNLREVTDTLHPDRILIEPTGVAKLSDIVRAVNIAALNTDLYIDMLITVADAQDAACQIACFGDFFTDQIENASVIILSRSQLADKSELEETVNIINEHNPRAALITTPWDQISADMILNAAQSKKDFSEELMAQCALRGHEHGHADHGHGHADHGDNHADHEHCHEDHEHCHADHEHSHDADEVFESWGIETPRRYSKIKIEEILEKITGSDEFGTVLRAKGIVQTPPGSWIHFDMIPGGYDIRENMPADYTGRICVIGTQLKKEALETLFSQ